jgi:energy-coupling factor transport system ATP-binding protein
MKDYFKYRYTTDIEFNLSLKTHVAIIGNSGDFFLDTLINNNDKCNIFIGDKEYTPDNKFYIRKLMSFVLYKHLNIFVGETVRDEIVFGLESLAFTKNEINERVNSFSRRFKLDNLLEKDPNSLGSSDKVKMKILSSLIIKPNVLVLDNVLCELDYVDKLLIFDILKEYTDNEGVVINITNDMEETLEANRIIIIHDNKLACDGKTISVLNEEKLLKRLGLGMPFIVELNKYLMDYGIINKYYLTNEKLVGALWK